MKPERGAADAAIKWRGFMTVSTEVDHNEYVGNGVTTSFPYTFRIFQKSDLVVQVVDLNEDITELIMDTDYTVTGAGGYSGGSVILTSPLAVDYQIAISRELPVTQETDLRNQGKFFAEVHENAFDKLTMLLQQVRSWLRLALRKPSFAANYYDALNNYIRNLRDPVRDQDAATKKYVDSQDADFDSQLKQWADDRFYNVSGDILTGPMQVANNTITGLPFPPTSTSPVRKLDLDAEVSARQAGDASLQAQINGTNPPAGSAFSVISWHDQSIPNSIIIPDNKNAWSFGPTITIPPGQSVTVGTNSFWTIANGQVQP